ncbi:MAG: TolB family protein, partial [Thermoplasmatota archaeon]
YKMDFDGSNDTRLTNNPAEDSLPAWAPDGSKIAFSSRRTDPAADVMLMNPDGTGVVDLTNSPGEDAWATWSPDSKQLAFHSRLDDPGGEEIYRINVDGTGRTRLTFNIVPGDPATSFDVFPAWSPDGTRIAFVSDRDGLRHIYAVAADGSGLGRQRGGTYARMPSSARRMARRHSARNSVSERPTRPPR